MIESSPRCVPSTFKSQQDKSPVCNVPLLHFFCDHAFYWLRSQCCKFISEILLRESQHEVNVITTRSKCLPLFFHLNWTFLLRWIFVFGLKLSLSYQCCVWSKITAKANHIWHSLYCATDYLQLMNMSQATPDTLHVTALKSNKCPALIPG